MQNEKGKERNLNEIQIFANKNTTRGWKEDRIRGNAFAKDMRRGSKCNHMRTGGSCEERNCIKNCHELLHFLSSASFEVESCGEQLWMRVYGVKSDAAFTSEVKLGHPWSLRPLVLFPCSMSMFSKKHGEDSE